MAANVDLRDPLARRQTVIEQIDSLLAALDQPLPDGERAAGWDEATRAQYREYFQRLRARLLDPRPLTEGERPDGLIRSFDMAGISDGTLLDTALQIEDTIYALESTHATDAGSAESVRANGSVGDNATPPPVIVVLNDTRLALVEATVAAFPALAAAWYAWGAETERERSAWRLTWASQMRVVEDLARALALGLLLPAQQERYARLRDRLASARGLLNQLGLAFPHIAARSEGSPADKGKHQQEQ